jgi:Putative S-adenosyl-L-methionine-dependent methyltransferase
MMTKLNDTGGRLLLELNRVLRPGGYFVWSATPVYQKLEEDVEIWKGNFCKAICQRQLNVINGQQT